MSRIGEKVRTERWGHVGVVVGEANCFIDLAESRWADPITPWEWFDLQEPPLPSGIDWTACWVAVRLDAGGCILTPSCDAKTISVGG